MWKSTILLLALFAAPSRSQPMQVGVYMRFDKTPPPASLLRTLQTAASELLAPANILISWQMLSDSDGSKLFPAVLILNFRGTCKTSPQVFLRERTAYDPFEQPTRIGATGSVAGQMTSEAEIQCDRIRQGLDVKLGAPSADVFARALARVVAHELYHHITGSAEHGGKGLAKPILGWDELGQSLMQFAASDLRKLKQPPSACLERNPCR